MEGFSYSNIFETKGIEYIAVIIFFAILVPFWILLNRRAKLRKEFLKRFGVLSESTLEIPQGVFLGNNHTWTHLDMSGIARVGLDDLLFHITGEVQLKVLKNLGDKIAKGDELIEISRNGKVLKILSPISGEIMDSNSLLSKNPEAINQDPYKSGWVCKIKPSSWLVETSGYYLAEEALKWTSKELVRFKDFLSASTEKYSAQPAMAVLQDGGELSDNPMSEMPKEVWQDFQTTFLKQP